MDGRPKVAFTLVELLVVISIIVVLLALLTPAMDQAIYQAELAVCAAQLRGVGSATLQYAATNKQWYPHRGVNSAYDAMQLKNRAVFDVPKLLATYITPDQFVDPLLPANLRVDECIADPNGVYMPGYHLYIDWRGTGAETSMKVRGMRRIGQKMVFDAPEGDQRSFNVIASDRDARSTAGATWSTNSHQDKKQLQSLWRYQEGGNPWTAAPANPAIGATVGHGMGPATGNVYVAWWLGTISRGLIDNNYVLDDGSVLQFKDVPVMLGLGDDERLTFAPDVATIEHYDKDRKAQLPRAN